jgi:hypothetical protein
MDKPKADLLPRAVAIIRQEGDDLAARLGIIKNFINSNAFKELSALDAQLLMGQAEAMQTYLRFLSIRVARANDAAKGIPLDVATALPGGKRGIILKGH